MLRQDRIKVEDVRERKLTSIHKGHIRYLLSTGKVEWDTMGRYIDGL